MTPAVGNSSDGFTLVEVMVTIILIAILFLGATQYIVHSRAGMSRAAREYLAWQAISNRFETIIASGYSALLDSSLLEIAVPLTIGGFQGYRSTRIVAIDDSLDGVDSSDTDLPDYMEVTVSLAWLDSTNIADSLAVYISEQRGE